MKDGDTSKWRIYTMSMTKHHQWIMENISFSLDVVCLEVLLVCLGFCIVKSTDKTVPQTKSNLELGLKEKFLPVFWTGNSGVSCVIVMFFRGDIVHGIWWWHCDKWEACNGLQENLKLVMNDHTLHWHHILQASMTKII